MSRRLASFTLDPQRPPWIIALGKAALPMARAAVELLEARGVQPAGGLVVGPAPAESPHPGLDYVRGDHPEPGVGSLAAATTLGNTAARITAEDEVWVLLSGGTTSLIGAPEPGLTPQELSVLYNLLLGSGLDITAMNRIRKRFSRWGGGKLARALAPARVRVYVVSDVIGDDLASIASGPCVADSTTAGEVRRLLQAANLWTRIPEAARTMVASVEAGALPETPKPGDRVFERVTLELVAGNRLALDAAARRATQLGLSPRVIDTPVAGEAAVAGAHLAATLLDSCALHTVPRKKVSDRPSCLIWGGETTVSLEEGTSGRGGRCQELALAGARILAEAGSAVALLAAGTDGRDGPTDAAGAIVDNHTWQTIAEAGRDPSHDLASHDAYPALDAAGALVRTGLTGTNVMDVMIGICMA